MGRIELGRIDFGPDRLRAGSVWGRNDRIPSHKLDLYMYMLAAISEMWH